ncbi:MAG: radical SAM protein [Desulfobacteraceae bacterium]|nr:radical SAM protein [Desulfobacteraceae bacterium]
MKISQLKGKEIQVIFSITRYCPFHCRICSMNAGPRQKKIPIGVLNVCKKLRGLLDLIDATVTFDISGGEPFDSEIFPVTLECLNILGIERCSLSSSGLPIDEEKLEQVSNIGGIDFTMDNVPYREKKDLRPPGYYRATERAIELCKKKGIPVTVMTILNAYTATNSNLYSIQELLDSYGVSSWFGCHYILSEGQQHVIHLSFSIQTYKNCLKHYLRKGYGPSFNIL